MLSLATMAGKCLMIICMHGGLVGLAHLQKSKVLFLFKRFSAIRTISMLLLSQLDCKP